MIGINDKVARTTFTNHVCSAIHAVHRVFQQHIRPNICNDVGPPLHEWAPILSKDVSSADNYLVSFRTECILIDVVYVTGTWGCMKQRLRQLWLMIVKPFVTKDFRH